MLLDIILSKDNKIVFEKKDVPAIIENNVLLFQMEDTKHEIDFDKKTFLRENEEFCFFIDSIEKKSTYLLKTHSVTLDIIVDFIQFKEGKHNCSLEYVIETDDQKNKIEIQW